MKSPLCSTIICFASIVMLLIGCRFWFITDLLEPCYFIPLNVSAATNLKQDLKIAIATTHAHPAGTFSTDTYIHNIPQEQIIPGTFSSPGTVCIKNENAHSHTACTFEKSCENCKVPGSLGKPCCESTLLLSAAVIICSDIGWCVCAWRTNTRKHTCKWIRLLAKMRLYDLYHPQFKHEVLSLALSQGSKQETGSKASMIPSKRMKCKRIESIF